jgi:hypothetical protein
MTTPLFMRDVSLTLKLVSGGATRTEFNCDVHTAEVLAAAGDVVEYRTLCPDGTFSSVSATSYSLHIVAAQDWSAGGLARFLFENDGALAEFQYQPHGATLIPPTDDFPGMTGEVRLIAPTMGGEADTYAELDVEMPCSTKPTLAVAAFPTLEEAEAEAVA